MQVLDLYTKYARQMEAQLPKLFGLCPRTNWLSSPWIPSARRTLSLRTIRPVRKTGHGPEEST